MTSRCVCCGLITRFQALEVPAGRHEVTLVYADRMFYYGALVSLVSMALWAGLWLRGRKRPSA